MLEKTLETPLDCNEIKPVTPKGNQPWIFIGRTDVEAEPPILWPPDAKNWLTGKDLDAGKDWRWEEKGMTEWDGSMTSPTLWTWVSLNSRSWWWTGRPGMLQYMGSQRVRHDWATELNWTDVDCIYQKLQYGIFDVVNIYAAAAKSLQSCLTLCDPIDGSPPGSAIPGIFQARTLEWVAISFSNAWKWKVKVKLLSRVRLLATPWTAAYQAPLSMGFSRQEYWSGVPLPSPVNIYLCVYMYNQYSWYVWKNRLLK